MKSKKNTDSLLIFDIINGILLTIFGLIIILPFIMQL